MHIQVAKLWLLNGVSLGPAVLISFQLQSSMIWISSCRATAHSSALQSWRWMCTPMWMHRACSFEVPAANDKPLPAQCRSAESLHLGGPLLLSVCQGFYHSSSTQKHLSWLYTDLAQVITLCFIPHTGASSKPCKEHSYTWAGWILDLASRVWHWQDL